MITPMIRVIKWLLKDGTIIMGLNGYGQLGISL